MILLCKLCHRFFRLHTETSVRPSLSGNSLIHFVAVKTEELISKWEHSACLKAFPCKPTWMEGWSGEWLLGVIRWCLEASKWKKPQITGAWLRKLIFSPKKAGGRHKNQLSVNECSPKSFPFFTFHMRQQISIIPIEPNLWVFWKLSLH